ncbi:3-phosphoserine/phosphohydroxythreonine transaminase [Alicyclobacillus ferrooxydans]|uniref:Phosphoserine aminotransferase n=1 Tax=Alicyclobacillus ferrooxydans TaxID=471514 RepID=A0A0P9F0C7_9BACL|nr:3-phosphoserine/phosphohydroxythreonine transaminase [Alicyclobacillus ferrooxydans]KPV44780.1 MFS transporter [Alicyclobacillus ferrooxydans]
MSRVEEKILQAGRADNFGAGPTGLPVSVLERIMQEGLSYQDSGMSVMEMSHRSRWYDAIQASAEAGLRTLLDIPDDFSVLFLQGGASLQFSMVPMNFLAEGKTAGYVTTGSFAKKAFSEAKRIGNAKVVASSEDRQFTTLPELDGAMLDPDLAYVHFTSNNTIYGTQWKDWPNGIRVPVVADMSSDILSRPIDFSRFDLIYAGAQKNLGIAGLTVVIVKRAFVLEHAISGLPSMLSYKVHLENDSRYNTPPVFSVYVLSLLLDWVKSLGGLDAMTARNEVKANLLYKTLDQSNGFYQGVASTEARSLMNVTFRLQNPDLEPSFLAAAKEAGFVGIGGHRSVGGCRVSLYNAVELEQVQRISKFMEEFRAQHTQMA